MIIYFMAACLVFFVGLTAYEKISKYLSIRRERQAKEMEARVADREARAEQAQREREQYNTMIAEQRADEAAEKQIGRDLLAANTVALNELQECWLSCRSQAANNYADAAARSADNNAIQQKQLNALIAALAANTAKVENDDATKLLAGTLKACEAIAESTVALKAVVEDFTKIVGQPRETASYPENNVQQPGDEREAFKSGLTFEAILRGLNPAQAAAEAEEEAEKASMVSGVDLS